MTVVLGAANAYLGLRAGQTIAATYPAAVIGMAVLRLVKGLDPGGEHRAHRRLHRRIGGRRRGFHLPAFFIAHVWAPPVIPDTRLLGRMWALAATRRI